MEIRNFEREAQANRSLLQSAYQKLDEQKKQAEQWKAIAEKLAEYLEIACDNQPSIEGCDNCPLPCAKGTSWIEQAKRDVLD